MSKILVDSPLPAYDPFGFGKIKGESPAINLGEGWSPEHTLPQHIQEAARKAVETCQHYLPFGLTELKKAIAKKLWEDVHVEYDPGREILITTGGIEAEHLILLTMIGAGEEVMMTDPGYRHSYEPNVQLAGGKMVYIPVREERRFKLDPKNVARKMSKRTKMLILISPDNPTGAVIESEDLERLAEIADKANLFILSDEVFRGMVYDGKKVPGIASLPGMKKRTFIVDSFSKSWNMAGFRIGYVAAPHEYLVLMANLQIHVTTSVSEISQAAALAALEGPKDWMTHAAQEYQMRRDRLVNGLNQIDGIRCLKPEGGRCAFPNISALGLHTLDFARLLLSEKTVSIIPTVEKHYGARAKNYCKIGFCKPLSQIDEGLERIKDLVNGLQWSPTGRARGPSITYPPTPRLRRVIRRRRNPPKQLCFSA
jgi:aminotransferase